MFLPFVYILNENLLFNEMNSDEIKHLLGCINPIVKHYEQNEIVFIQGDKTEYLYIILLGKVNVYSEDLNGNRHLMSGFSKNDIMAEVLIFSGDNVFPFTSISETKSEIMLIPKKAFYEVCGSPCSCHSKLIRNMLKILADKAFFLNKKIELLTTQSVRERIGKYLIFLYMRQGNEKIVLPYNREQLAEFINVARPSLSRELGRMKSEGLIDFDKNEITLLNILSEYHY